MADSYGVAEGGVKRKGNKGGTSVVAVGATATQILASNANRISALPLNAGGSDVFLGRAATVTTATGFKLAAGRWLEDCDSIDAWYGVCAASGTVHVIEVS